MLYENHTSPYEKDTDMTRKILLVAVAIVLFPAMD
jgi:hypothetical protein